MMTEDRYVCYIIHFSSSTDTNFYFKSESQLCKDKITYTATTRRNSEQARNLQSFVLLAVNKLLARRIE